MRTRDFRRHHRERVIRNRLFVIRNAWYHSPRPSVRPPWWERAPGLLDTTHLCACSCAMCKGERYERHKEKRMTAPLLGLG